MYEFTSLKLREALLTICIPSENSNLSALWSHLKTPSLPLLLNVIVVSSAELASPSPIEIH